MPGGSGIALRETPQLACVPFSFLGCIRPHCIVLYCMVIEIFALTLLISCCRIWRDLVVVRTLARLCLKILQPFLTWKLAARMDKSISTVNARCNFLEERIEEYIEVGRMNYDYYADISRQF